MLTNMKDQEITIIGAGLVGCFMAILLAKDSFKVKIFEKKPDPRLFAKKGKSINLGISTRGINAFKKIGCYNEIIRMTVPMYGRLIHNINATEFQSYGTSENQVLFSANRKELVYYLLNLAEQENNISICFNMECKEIDLSANRLTLLNTNTNMQIESKFTTLFGADGVHSFVRKSIEKHFNSPDRTRKFPMIYKQFNIENKNKVDSALERINCFHIWPGINNLFFTALPNVDNTFNCALFTPSDNECAIDRIPISEIKHFFKCQFAPGLIDIVDVVSDHSHNEVGCLWTVNTNYWHFEDKVVVIGDAAHGVVPYYGLGVNVGFEDCLVIKDLIPVNTQGDHIDWKSIFKTFSRRKIDTDSLARLSEGNANIFHTCVKDDFYLFNKRVERELANLYPSKFAEAHDILSFKLLPHSEAEVRIMIQNQIIDLVCQAGTNTVDYELADELIQKRLSDIY